MKKYIAYYSIAITLFFTSIASAMDLPFAISSPADIRKILQSLSHDPETASAHRDSSMLADSYTLSSESTYRRPSRRFGHRNIDIINPVRFSLTPHDPIAAENHNKHIPLIATDKDILGLIWNQFVNKNDSLSKNIKNILALSATCTYFNNKLEDFGKMLQCYDNESKNALLTRCLHCSDAAYWKIRRSFLLLVYAGAEHNTCRPNYPLLNKAVDRCDLDMITTLFRYGADANLQILNGEPVFWHAKTSTMAQLFVDNGADLNISRYDTNALSYCLDRHEYKPELIQFYIDKKVNPRILDLNKGSLLNCIAFTQIKDDNAGLKIVTILLNTIGDMINALDNKGKTALDLLIERKTLFEQNDHVFSKKKIIALFKEYGAKTSQELKLIELAKKKEKAPMIIQQDKPVSCIICLGAFGKQDEQVNLPCQNNHPTDIHVECYNDLLKHSTACPLCRAELQ